MLQSKAVLQYADHSHAAGFVLYHSIITSFFQFIKLHWEGERERFYLEMRAVCGVGNVPGPKLSTDGNSGMADGKGNNENTHTVRVLS